MTVKELIEALQVEVARGRGDYEVLYDGDFDLPIEEVISTDDDESTVAQVTVR